MTYTLIEPDLGRTSGGLRFNSELAAAAEGRIERITAPGTWAEPAGEDVARLRQLVARCQEAGDAAAGRDRPVLIDGLIGCSLPTPLQGPIVILQHSLAQTPAAARREAVCLRSASAVVTTSAFAAAEVARKYGITAEVALPGTHPRSVTQPGSPAHLICLAAMENNKNQLFLAHVFQELRRRGITDWRCTFAGPITDTDYAADVRDALSGLSSVDCVGELDGAAVDELYRHADLLLLPSKTETFGMVVREGAAAAIPSLVSAGTGAQEALVAGHALELDVPTWADALERWMRDATYRTELAATALEARESSVHGWDETARTMLSVMESVS